MRFCCFFFKPNNNIFYKKEHNKDSVLVITNFFKYKENLKQVMVNNVIQLVSHLYIIPYNFIFKNNWVFDKKWDKELLRLGTFIEKAEKKENEKSKELKLDFDALITKEILNIGAKIPSTLAVKDLVNYDSIFFKTI